MSHFIVKLQDFEQPRRVQTLHARDGSGPNDGDVELLDHRGSIMYTVNPNGIESIELAGYVKTASVPPTEPALAAAKPLIESNAERLGESPA